MPLFWQHWTNQSLFEYLTWWLKSGEAAFSRPPWHKRSTKHTCTGNIRSIIIDDSVFLTIARPRYHVSKMVLHAQERMVGASNPPFKPSSSPPCGLRDAMECCPLATPACLSGWEVVDGRFAHTSGRAGRRIVSKLDTFRTPVQTGVYTWNVYTPVFRFICLWFWRTGARCRRETKCFRRGLRQWRRSFRRRLLDWTPKDVRDRSPAWQRWGFLIVRAVDCSKDGYDGVVEAWWVEHRHSNTPLALYNALSNISRKSSRKETIILCIHGTCDGPAYMKADLRNVMRGPNGWFLFIIRDSR